MFFPWHLLKLALFIYEMWSLIKMLCLVVNCPPRENHSSAGSYNFSTYYSKNIERPLHQGEKKWLKVVSSVHEHNILVWQPGSLWCTNSGGRISLIAKVICWRLLRLLLDWMAGFWGETVMLEVKIEMSMITCGNAVGTGNLSQRIKH